MAITLLRDDLFSTFAGSAQAEAVLLAAFPYANVPVFAATACLGPFDLDPAEVLGRQPPGHILLRCFDLGAAFVLGAPASPRPPLHWRAFAFLPHHPSSCGCSECSPIVILIRALLPASVSVLQLSAPGRRSAVVDTCLGLAWCSTDSVFFQFMQCYVQRSSNV